MVAGPLSLALVCAANACASGNSNSNAGAESPASPVAQSMVPASAVLDPKAEPVPASVSLPASVSDKAELLRPICEVAYDAASGAIGCRECPPYGAPSHVDPVARPPAAQVDAVLRGSFTRVGAEEVAVSFVSQNCATRAERGGTALVEKSGGGYRFLRYVHGVTLDQCEARPRKGERDLLLCESSFVGSGSVELSAFIYDFNQTEAEVLPLFVVRSNTEAACEHRQTSGKLLEAEVAETKVVDSNKDGREDLLFALTSRKLPSESARAKGGCKKAAGQGKLQQFNLEFLSDGKRYAPTAATRQLLERFDME